MTFSGEQPLLDNMETVFKKYYGSLCYYASHYVVDIDLAQDLVQDVFVHLIETRQVFETPVHCRNFLYLSVRNACLNSLQKNTLKERHRQYVLENEFFFDIPDEEVLTAEVYRQLTEAVDELPGECRKIFYMSYFENKNNETIAQLLGISVNTVRAQKMRGKQLLKNKLKNLFPLIFVFPGLF